MAPRVGFEPTTLRLTAGCSAVELPRNVRFICAQENIIRKSKRLARTFFKNFCDDAPVVNRLNDNITSPRRHTLEMEDASMLEFTRRRAYAWLLRHRRYRI